MTLRADLQRFVHFAVPLRCDPQKPDMESENSGDLTHINPHINPILTHTHMMGVSENGPKPQNQLAFKH